MTDPIQEALDRVIFYAQRYTQNLSPQEHRKCQDYCTTLRAMQTESVDVEALKREFREVFLGTCSYIHPDKHPAVSRLVGAFLDHLHQQNYLRTKPVEIEGLGDALNELIEHKKAIPTKNFTPQEYREWESQKAYLLNNLWIAVSKSVPYHNLSKGE